MSSVLQGNRSLEKTYCLVFVRLLMSVEQGGYLWWRGIGSRKYLAFELTLTIFLDNICEFQKQNDEKLFWYFFNLEFVCWLIIILMCLTSSYLLRISLWLADFSLMISNMEFISKNCHFVSGKKTFKSKRQIGIHYKTSALEFVELTVWYFRCLYWLSLMVLTTCK